MDRRGFLKLFAGAAVAAVAAEAIPFNRVWSFPSQIRIATLEEVPLYGADFQACTLDDLVLNVAYENFFVDSAKLKWLRSIGSSRMENDTMILSPFTG